MVTTEMTEVERLSAFLLALQTSRTRRQKFIQNPKAEMRRFNLAPKTIDAVYKRDIETFWKILLPPYTYMTKAVGVGKKGRRRRRKRT